MAAKKIILQVSYPGIGTSPYKTVAFSPTMTVEEACKICATKGGLKDKQDEYGLCIKDSGAWLKSGDTLEAYPLQNCSGLEFKPTPKKTTVTYEGEDKKMDVDFSLTGSEVLGNILDALGEAKSNEWGMSLVSETDGTKKSSVDYTKPLIDQANPSETKIILKKKSKIGGIFRRTDSHKLRGSIMPPSVSSSGLTKIFGVPLAQVAHPAKYGGLPAVAAKTIEYLEEVALQLEGIFRISGNQSEVLAMKKAFDDGQDVNVRESSSPHVVAGLLKLYLRDLPEPLFPYSLYEIFMSLYNNIQNEAVRVTYYKVLIDTLPIQNQMLLFRLLPFLANVVKYEDVNKMAIHNVATVFGPNLLRSSDTSAIAMIQGTAAVNAITCEIIQNYEEIIEVCENDFCSIALSLYAYEGKTESEVSFGEGEIVFVIKEDTGGWWEGEVNGNYGFFPSNYVKSILKIQKDDKDGKPTKPKAPEPKKEEPAAQTTVAAKPAVQPVAVTKPAAVIKPAAANPVATKPVEANPVVNKPAANKPVGANNQVGRPAAGTTGGRGAGGGSKQKFMQDLEDLKKIAKTESENNAKLQSLVENLAKEVEKLKQQPSSSSNSSGGDVSGLQQTVSDMRSEVQKLSDSNSKLESELQTTNENIAEAKKQLDSLKTEEIALKRDLKILQFKCDKLKPEGGTSGSRRQAPSLNK